MTATATPPIGKVIDRLAADFKSDHGIPAGDIAALRRYRPGDGGSPVFWKLAVHYLEPDGYLPEYEGTARERAEKRWAAILAGMAETKGQHDKKRKLGKVLKDQDVKEHRVLRLLRARDVPLLRIVRSVVHQLSSAGAAFDWNDLAQLIVSDGTQWEKSVRRRIARDYYRPGLLSPVTTIALPRPRPRKPNRRIRCPGSCNFTPSPPTPPPCSIATT